MADQYLLPQHPHGEKDAVHTMVLLLNFLQSPDFQFRSGRRADITARFGDIDGGDYFEVQDDGTLHLVGAATRTWLAYGDMHVHDAPLTITWGVGEADDWVAILGYADEGFEKRVTRDEANGTLTIDSDGAGVYYVGFDISAQATGGGLELHGAIWIDSGSGFVKADNVSSRRTISAGGSYGSFSAHNFCELSAGDVLRIELQSDTSSRSIVIDHMQFAIHKIGE